MGNDMARNDALELAEAIEERLRKGQRWMFGGDLVREVLGDDGEPQYSKCGGYLLVEGIEPKHHQLAGRTGWASVHDLRSEVQWLAVAFTGSFFSSPTLHGEPPSEES